MGSGRLWAIVLAAGDGCRVRDMARDEAGRPVPKQFWKFDGRRSLLRATLERIEPLIPAARTVPVVAEGHARWWSAELAGIPSESVVSQPLNRGTAAGILLPLLRVLRRDPEAAVVVLPSDHWVNDEPVLRRTIVAAAGCARRRRSRIVLLGIVPERDDREYGWILPRQPGLDAEADDVVAFVEKPDAAHAPDLVRRGAVINSLILVARGAALLRLFDLSVPRLVGDLVGHEHEDGAARPALAEIYEALPAYDFSRQVLQPLPHLLSVVTVPPCGWVDVGVADRAARVLAQVPRKAARPMERRPPPRPAAVAQVL